MKPIAMLAVFVLLTSCGGKVAVDTGAGGNGNGGNGSTSTCPAPHPEPCNSEEPCSCVDGTTQIGGCPTGFTCDEACCGHGGQAG